MVVNASADWGEEGEINISPDNIEVKCFFSYIYLVAITPDNYISIHVEPLLEQQGKQEKVKQRKMSRNIVFLLHFIAKIVFSFS